MKSIMFAVLLLTGCAIEPVPVEVRIPTVRIAVPVIVVEGRQPRTYHYREREYWPQREDRYDEYDRKRKGWYCNRYGEWGYCERDVEVERR